MPHDTHQPVLLKEVIEGLAIQPDGIYIDATFGRGGHSGAILAALGKQGRLIAIDRDPEAISAGRERYGQDTRFTLIQGSFSMLRNIAQQQQVEGKVNGILLDLGVSSPQLNNPERGFSFLHDGPLDMRMDPTARPSAAEWINYAKEEEMATVFKTYGEERHARRIARAIVAARALVPFTRTEQLASVVSKANPSWERFKHPATRCFQAIRIFINRELDELQECLATCLDVLAVKGRLLVISFHSLEDRIVKRYMRQQAKGDDIPSYLPVQQVQLHQRLQRVGGAIKPSDSEISGNTRARSAVLRIGEKLL